MGISDSTGALWVWRESVSTCWYCGNGYSWDGSACYLLAALGKNGSLPVYAEATFTLWLKVKRAILLFMRGLNGKIKACMERWIIPEGIAFVFLDFDVNGNIGVFLDRLQPMGGPSSILFTNASRLCLDSEGSLTVYRKSFLDICESLQDVGKPQFHNGTASGCILPGTTLKTCQMLKTGDYYAILDYDSNLKIFSSNSETAASLIWSTGHQGPPASLDYKFVFQTDGNLVLYDGNQRVISETGLLTLDKPATDLCLTPEGNYAF
ncbi:hypothetical protein BDR26DRAFT_946854 [Obelidium mucronatum]|nr:hypothetical protein BDR26DRAFT_946854 [Obelidium mucronatum]